MHWGIWPSIRRPWRDIVDIARHCEETGWGSIYLSDHFMPASETGAPADGPTMECWTSLAGLAALTSRARVGSLVTSVTYRHPTILANAAAAIDHISSGRFVLGLGAGWQANEHRAYGLELGRPAARLDRLKEACIVITGLLTSNRSTFEGEYYRLENAPCEPKPLQRTLPLLIGGTGERRTMAIAAEFAQEWNGWCTADDFRHKTLVLDRHCEALGRDPSTISRSISTLLFISDDKRWLADCRRQPDDRPRLIGTSEQIVQQVADYAESGVDEIIIYDTGLVTTAAQKVMCDQFIAEVAQLFKSSGLSDDHDNYSDRAVVDQR